MTWPRTLFLLIASAVGARYFSAWCAFPLADWNALRLAPSFMLRFGPTPYPGMDDGPVTTWIYGPVPLWLNLPATFASTPAGALLTAATLNLGLVLIPLLLVLRSLPRGERDAWPGPLAWAGLLGLALWPNSSLHYLQADNVAVAFGLVANAWLMRHGATSNLALAGAAVCAALAVWSKQTSLGVVAAHLIWLGWARGWQPALRYAAACLAAGLTLAGLFVVRFGFEPLWLNLVTLPGRLPFWPEPFDRAAGLAPHLLGYVLLPAIAVVGWRRAIFRPDSLWMLPVLTWLLVLPMGLLSAFKVGGTANSLTGALYLLPSASLLAVQWLERYRLRRLAPALAIGAVLALQLTQIPVVTLRPLTTHLDRAAFLAREFPGQIYFPWNPLITFYSEQRVYHAEDGLYVRQLAGAAVSNEAVRMHLPPGWSVTVFRGSDTGWGLVQDLHPPDTQRAAFAEWTIYSWPPPP